MRKRPAMLPAVVLFAVVCAWGPGAADGLAQSIGAADSLARLPGAAFDSADLAELSAYRLTMEKFERWDRAVRNLFERIRADPGLVGRLGWDGEGYVTFDVWAARAEADSAVRGAIEDAGLEVREFVVIPLAYYQSVLAQSVIDRGADREEVIRDVRVHPANLEFVREHDAELVGILRALTALMPAQGS